MGLPRDLVVDLLKAQVGAGKPLQGVVVMPYAKNIAAPSKSTVMVRVDEVRPSSSAYGARDYRFALVCIAAKTTAGPADDELDGLLEDVLYAVQKCSQNHPGGVRFEQATRATYGEPDPTNPAYEVAITVTTPKEN